MAAIVEHDKRKEEILQKSIEIFVSEGYKNVTIQKIADHCVITRTTLYIYFKNKHEIFMCSIKRVKKKIEFELLQLLKKNEFSNQELLKQMMFLIINVCEENAHLFSVIINYIQQVQKNGYDPHKRVMHYVIKLRHILSSVLIQGMETGEFRKLDLKSTNELFFSLLEGLIFRMVILDLHDHENEKNMISVFVDSLKA